jgi:hypothetical protein
MPDRHALKSRRCRYRSDWSQKENFSLFLMIHNCLESDKTGGRRCASDRPHPRRPAQNSSPGSSRRPSWARQGRRCRHADWIGDTDGERSTALNYCMIGRDAPINPGVMLGLLVGIIEMGFDLSRIELTRGRRADCMMDWRGARYTESEHISLNNCARA